MGALSVSYRLALNSGPHLQRGNCSSWSSSKGLQIFHELLHKGLEGTKEIQWADVTGKPIRTQQVESLQLQQCLLCRVLNSITGHA